LDFNKGIKGTKEYTAEAGRELTKFGGNVTETKQALDTVRAAEDKVSTSTQSL